MIAMHRITLLLGSNIRPEKHFFEALRELSAYGRIVQCSHLWATAPIGSSTDAWFYNAVVVLESKTSGCVWQEELIPSIEDRLGRIRDPDDKCAPRTIDLDLLDPRATKWELPFVSQLLAEADGLAPPEGPGMRLVMGRERLMAVCFEQQGFK
jgi:2-amino-4-hydroxy-6-hydroxymethyldihydropteridine diphosphokinase